MHLRLPLVILFTIRADFIVHVAVPPCFVRSPRVASVRKVGVRRGGHPKCASAIALVTENLVYHLGLKLDRTW
ncbi:hypothetical protein BDN72DRAFT_851069 [Pluteus cervinus]|uniref:Uncharacterized protein n=1 Tax=Pluteus cervinus TaxID=181527 RepID=A0ACD3A2X3_9AGAR|nr:hypothetical protein BDN72DRAFT_851069 [Pluteus cervinus]